MVSPDLLAAKQALSHRLLTTYQPQARRDDVRTMSVAMAIEQIPSNIHAVGVGRKTVDGKTTDQLCVRVYVVEKLAASLLPESLRVPEAIDGIPTDVIESPRASLAPSCTHNRRMRQRPAPAGISAGHFGITAGTLSVYCRSVRPGDDPTDGYALSNNHVFAKVNAGSPGDAIYQPGVADGGGPADRIGALSRFHAITLSHLASNRIDAAIARLDPGFPFDAAICSIGVVSAAKNGEEGQLVRKHGRTSGYTEGEITDEALDVIVGMDHHDSSVVAKFEDQLRIAVTPPFASFGLGGDSGSLVVDRHVPTAVGLFFAGPPGGQYGLANPIEEVLSLLEIELL